MSGVFVVLIGLTMIAGEIGYKPVLSLTSQRMLDLKAALRANPVDEPLKKSIRELDLQQRRRYFRQLSQMHSGAYLLSAGVAVFVFTVSRISRLRKQPPLLKAKGEISPAGSPAAVAARWSVACSGTAVGVLLFIISVAIGNAGPEKPSPAGQSAAPAPAQPAPMDPVVLAEMKRSWPRFRGPEGGGCSPFTNEPTRWDVKTGAGILWKATVPAPGFNSPISWGERVFFSGGDARSRAVFCLDAKTGQTLWKQDVTNVPGSPSQGVEIPDTTGYSACSMATDGHRVYVIFANGDLAALSLEGKPVWSKSFGPLKNPYGYATSLATWNERVILQLDQGESDDGKSKLYALDGQTGQVVWQTPRKVGSSWATPIVIDAVGKTQIITMAVPWVISYSAADGSELWRVDCLNGEITPSPIFASGLVMLFSPSDRLLAIRPDGQGDVSKTKIAWASEENVPDVTSPVSNGDLVFTITTPGLLTCFDAKTGKKLWEHDYDMEFHSSPGIAGKVLYLFGQKGTALVVEAAPEFKEIYRTEMGDAFHASPVFLDGRIIMRGTTNIWCLGAAAPVGK
ncbi:MAG TPA: PQQ-binding-like beta-propeller repeat protein [Verrucomicrobiae bacterium]|nr:PQQ-binding-like beta-propeller repeat protein [Verrucomicrobiae bacterium]